MWGGETEVAEKRPESRPHLQGIGRRVKQRKRRRARRGSTTLRRELGGGALAGRGRRSGEGSAPRPSASALALLVQPAAGPYLSRRVFTPGSFKAQLAEHHAWPARCPRVRLGAGDEGEGAGGARGSWNTSAPSFSSSLRSPTSRSSDSPSETGSTLTRGGGGGGASFPTPQLSPRLLPASQRGGWSLNLNGDEEEPPRPKRGGVGSWMPGTASLGTCQGTGAGAPPVQASGMTSPRLDAALWLESGQTLGPSSNTVIRSQGNQSIPQSREKGPSLTSPETSREYDGARCRLDSERHAFPASEWRPPSSFPHLPPRAPLSDWLIEPGQ
nr:PREDICTED: putative protein TPRXL [Equus przewalskii]